MVRILEHYPPRNFDKIMKKVEVRVHGFPKEKLDERTFYMTISLHYKKNSQVCDVIYLVDRSEFTAAFSLNKHYQNVRNFFLKHFRHVLSYHDEMQFAKLLTKTKEFQSYFQEYSNMFPKFVSNFKSTCI